MLKNALGAIALLTALLTSPHTHAASVSIDDVKAIKESAQAGDFAARAHWTALSYYLQGAMEAIALAQRALEQSGSHALFCPPNDGSLSMDNIYRFLDQASEAGHRGPALNALLDAFKARYPCPSNR